MKPTTPIFKFLLPIALAFGLTATKDSMAQQNDQESNSGNHDVYRVVAVNKTGERTKSVSNTVTLEKNFTLYIPNAFTPNGDGTNDRFQPVARGVESLRLEIFNRWGEKIHESNGKDADWDGTYQGEKVQNGVYVYKLRAQTESGEYISKEGQVTVVN